MKLQVRAVLALGALALGGGWPALAVAQPIATTDPLAPAAPADPAAQVTPDADRMARWVMASGDHGRLPFIVIDKGAAALFVFSAEGQFIGTTPALLGSALGDGTVVGIGDRELSAIRPDQRTTPAGRFVATFGPAKGLGRVLWVDYASALAMHPIVRGTRKERRQQRLASPPSDDNRVTYGCINISASFFKDVVRTLFRDATGVVYILPETRQLQEVFTTFRDAGTNSPG